MNQLKNFVSFNQVASSYIPGTWLLSRSAHPWESKYTFVTLTAQQRKQGLEWEQTGHTMPRTAGLPGRGCPTQSTITAHQCSRLRLPPFKVRPSGCGRDQKEFQVAFWKVLPNVTQMPAQQVSLNPNCLPQFFWMQLSYHPDKKRCRDMLVGNFNINSSKIH